MCVLGSIMIVLTALIVLDASRRWVQILAPRRRNKPRLCFRRDVGQTEE
jgi:hypothetical protein